MDRRLCDTAAHAIGPPETATLFCTGCEKYLCATCSQVIHKLLSSHVVKTLSDIGPIHAVKRSLQPNSPAGNVNDRRDSLQEGIESAEDAIKEAAKLLADNERAQAAFSSGEAGQPIRDAARKRLQEEFGKLRVALDAREKALLAGIERYCERRVADLKDEHEQLEDIVPKLNGVVAESRRLMGLDDSALLDVKASSFTGLVAAAPDLPDPRPHPTSIPLVFAHTPFLETVATYGAVGFAAPEGLHASLSDNDVVVRWDAPRACAHEPSEYTLEVAVEGETPRPFTEEYRGKDTDTTVWVGTRKGCTLRMRVRAEDGMWSPEYAIVVPVDLFRDGSILFTEEQEMLCTWTAHLPYRLLYRGTRDGFSAKNFHTICDGQANTITVIRAQTGAVFGGYTTVPISGPHALTEHPDFAAFLFARVPGHGLEQNRLRTVEVPNAVSFASNLLCMFGSGDLRVVDGSSKNPGSCRKPNGCYRAPQNLYGREDFLAAEIEVFVPVA